MPIFLFTINDEVFCGILYNDVESKGIGAHFDVLLYKESKVRIMKQMLDRKLSEMFNRRRYSLLLVIFLLTGSMLYGCTSEPTEQSYTAEQEAEQNSAGNGFYIDETEEVEDDVIEDDADNKFDFSEASDDGTDKIESESVANDTTTSDFASNESATDESFTISSQTEAYAVIEDNIPQFPVEDMGTTAFETYSEQDSLGRCGVAYANICRELMPTEERGAIGHIRPSGWHTVKYDCIADRYLYNRCHLIGFQLAGENDNEKNLITGTRYMNVEGMLPFENQVADYVEATGNHVLYRVTPRYEGNNLVADGVRMEAYSVEDHGAGVCFDVFVYNKQPGISIDYATGESYESGETWSVGNNNTIDANGEIEDSNTSVSNATETDNKSAENEQQQVFETVGTDYIVNKNTEKFHYPSCSSVDDMKEENKLYFNGLREQLIDQGFVPCKRCNP